MWACLDCLLLICLLLKVYSGILQLCIDDRPGMRTVVLAHSSGTTNDYFICSRRFDLSRRRSFWSQTFIDRTASASDEESVRDRRVTHVRPEGLRELPSGRRATGRIGDACA